MEHARLRTQASVLKYHSFTFTTGLITFMYSVYTAATSRLAVERVIMQPLAWWDYGFEPLRGLGCICL